MTREVVRLRPDGSRDACGALTMEGAWHVHKFLHDGRPVGYAELKYFGRPVRFYMLDYIKIEDGEDQHGYGTELLEAVNEFLLEKQAVGMLFNMHERRGGHLKDWYANHGWSSVDIPGEGRGYMVFNPPAENLSPEVLKAMVSRDLTSILKTYGKSAHPPVF